MSLQAPPAKQATHSEELRHSCMLPSLGGLSISSHPRDTDGFYMYDHAKDLGSLLMKKQSENNIYRVVSPLFRSMAVQSDELKAAYTAAMAGHEDVGVFCVSNEKIVRDASLMCNIKNLAACHKGKETANAASGKYNQGHAMGKLSFSIGTQIKEDDAVFAKHTMADLYQINEQSQCVKDQYNRVADYINDAHAELVSDGHSYRIIQELQEDYLQRHVIAELLALDFSIQRGHSSQVTLPCAFATFKNENTAKVFSVSKQANDDLFRLIDHESKMRIDECENLAASIIEAALKLGRRGFALCNFRLENILVTQTQSMDAMEVWPIDFDPLFTWQLHPDVDNREYIAAAISIHIFFVSSYELKDGTRRIDALLHTLATKWNETLSANAPGLQSPFVEDCRSSSPLSMKFMFDVTELARRWMSGSADRLATTNFLQMAEKCILKADEVESLFYNQGISVEVTTSEGQVTATVIGVVASARGSILADHFAEIRDSIDSLQCSSDPAEAKLVTDLKRSVSSLSDANPTERRKSVNTIAQVLCLEETDESKDLLVQRLSRSHIKRRSKPAAEERVVKALKVVCAAGSSHVNCVAVVEK